MANIPHIELIKIPGVEIKISKIEIKEPQGNAEVEEGTQIEIDVDNDNEDDDGEIEDN